MRVHHIGIIVKDIEQSLSLYSMMGYKKRGDILVDYIQNNYIVFLQSESSPALELIMPINKSSSVYNCKEGYHHICYEHEIGEDFLETFKQLKIGKIFTNPIRAPAIDNRKVVFAFLRNRVLVEFLL